MGGPHGATDTLSEDPVLPLRRTRLSDRLVDDLLDTIVGRHLVPGQELPSEPDIALRYGCSKVVVRESIQTLANLGFVRVQQGRRSTVAAEHEWDVNSPLAQAAYRREGRSTELLTEILEARLVVEPAIARLAAVRATARQREELGSAVVRLVEAVEHEDGRAFRASDARFHALLGEMCGNASLRSILRDLMHYVHVLLPDTQAGSEESLVVSERHSSVAKAIVDGQPEESEARARDAVDVVRRFLLERADASASGHEV